MAGMNAPVLTCGLGLVFLVALGMAAGDAHAQVDPRIAVLGDLKMAVNGAPYVEPGAACVGMDPTGFQGPLRVTIRYEHDGLGRVQQIDYKVPGTYRVTYLCTDHTVSSGFTQNAAYREVKVTTAKPVIVMHEKNLRDKEPMERNRLPMNLVWGDTTKVRLNAAYEDPGATCVSATATAPARVVTAIDTRTAGDTQTVRYTCTLGGVEADPVERKIIVTATDNKPVIQGLVHNGEYDTIKGDFGFADPGCIDDIDGDIRPVRTGNVDTTAPGPHTVTYDCTDSAGNKADRVSVDVTVLNNPTVDLGKYLAPSSHLVAPFTYPPPGCGDPVQETPDIEAMVDSDGNLFVSVPLGKSSTSNILTHFHVTNGTATAGEATIYDYNIIENSTLAPRFDQSFTGDEVSAAFVVPADYGIKFSPGAMITVTGVADNDNNLQVGGNFVAKAIRDSAITYEHYMLFGSADQTRTTLLDATGTPDVIDRLYGYTSGPAPFTENHDPSHYGCSPVANTVTVMADSQGPIPRIVDGSPHHVIKTEDNDGTDFDVATSVECVDNLSDTFTPTIRTQSDLTTLNAAIDANTTGEYSVGVACSDGSNSRNGDVSVIIDGAKPVIAGDRQFHSVSFGAVGGSDDLPLRERTCTDDVDPDRPAVLTEAVDFFKLGNYKVTYTCEDRAGRAADPVSYNVDVNDPSPPVASIMGGSSVNWPAGIGWDENVYDRFVCTEPQGTPTSNTEIADFTASSAIAGGSSTVVFRCAHNSQFGLSGSQGNSNAATLTVNFVEDTMRPAITVTGDSEVSIMVNTAYDDAGATCMDTLLNVPRDVTAVSTVDNSTAGRYVVSYDCESVSEMDAHTAHRVVLVSSTGAAPAEGDKLTPILHKRGTEYTDPGYTCTDMTAATIGGQPVIWTGDSVDMTLMAANFTVTYYCGSSQFTSHDRDVVVVNEVPGPVFEADPEDAQLLEIKLNSEFPGDAVVCSAGGTPVITTSDLNVKKITTGDDTYTVQVQCPGAYGVLSAPETIKISVVSDVRPSDDDWKLNPTFGRSWSSGIQVVEDGFSFNGRAFDVTDNYHVDFTRSSSEIGGTNTITMKAYAEVPLDTLSLSLGVPELSRVTDSEADIHVKLRADYTLPAEYEVIDIIHEQDEDLLDTSATTVAVDKVLCNSNTEAACHEVTIGFRVMAPFSSEALAISVMDQQRRITTTYINDGVEFTGESLLPADTATIHFKRGNQHPVETVHLTQDDRRYNLWSDQDGYAWLRNGYGSWFQLTQAGFERLQDPAMTVMTRTHSSFEDLVVQERQKALAVFDAEDIRKQVGESFSHDAPVKIEKLKDPVVLEKLKIAELRAMEYLENLR